MSVRDSVETPKIVRVPLTLEELVADHPGHRIVVHPTPQMRRRAVHLIRRYARLLKLSHWRLRVIWQDNPQLEKDFGLFVPSETRPEGILYLYCLVSIKDLHGIILRELQKALLVPIESLMKICASCLGEEDSALLLRQFLTVKERMLSQMYQASRRLILHRPKRFSEFFHAGWSGWSP